MRPITLWLILIALATGCTTSIATRDDTLAEDGWHCTPPPSSFEVSKLVGEWLNVDEVAVSRDVITLREDGTYTQSFATYGGIDYESSSNTWWIEERDSGGIYLHLAKMRYCDTIEEVCLNPVGGDGEGFYYDVCEDRIVEMEGEVILAVVGTQGSRHPVLRRAPQGIALMHMQIEPDRAASFFILSED
jgi:hypothetical protein